jgi:hypothetical protein
MTVFSRDDLADSVLALLVGLTVVIFTVGVLGVVNFMLVVLIVVFLPIDGIAGLIVDSIVVNVIVGDVASVFTIVVTFVAAGLRVTGKVVVNKPVIPSSFNVLGVCTRFVNVVLSSTALVTCAIRPSDVDGGTVVVHVEGWSVAWYTATVDTKPVDTVVTVWMIVVAIGAAPEDVDTTVVGGSARTARVAVGMGGGDALDVAVAASMPLTMAVTTFPPLAVVMVVSATATTPMVLLLA